MMALYGVFQQMISSGSRILAPGSLLKEPLAGITVREKTLPVGAVIATSYIRREEAVKQLFEDVRFVDLRGTIGERLAILFNG